MKLNSSQRVVIIIAIITIDELEIVVGSQPPGSGLESFGGKDRGVGVWTLLRMINSQLGVGEACQARSP